MPTIITHALLPLIGCAAFPGTRPSSGLIAAGMLAAALPDADVVSRAFLVPHTADFGHRGATHTLIFAVLAAGLAAIPGRFREGRITTFIFILLSTLSHPLIDMLTDGGKGIMIFWPVESDRFKFMFHPVQASPIGLRGFRCGIIWSVLASELLWLILPAALLAAMVRLAAKTRIRSVALIDRGAKRT